MDVSQLGNVPLVNWLRLILLAANLLLILCFQLPMSLSNCWLQVHSALIHPNLRSILLVQSLSFSMYGIVRLIQICILFTLGPEHLLDGPWLQFALIFTLIFMNAIGHVLLLERLLATLLYRRYEHIRNPLFCVLGFSVMTLYIAYNTYNQVFQSNDPNDILKITPVVLATACFWPVLAFVEIFIISLIGAFNLKQYRRQMRIQGEHNLSERFQISENIKTARQLGPAFAFHFVGSITGPLFPILVFSRLLTGPIAMEMFSEIAFLITSFINAMIEYTILSRHPVLRRNVLQLLSRLAMPLSRNRNRIENSNMHLGPIAAAGDGQRSQTVDQHFEMLRQEWG